MVRLAPPGKVRKIQRRFILEHQPSFQFMRQFAHIPGPAISQQPLPALLGDLALRQAVLPAKLGQQMLRQSQNVLAALAQGGRTSRYKSNRCSRSSGIRRIQRGSKVTACGSNDPHVDLDLAVAPHPADLAVFQRRQNFGLHGRG